MLQLTTPGTKLAEARLPFEALRAPEPERAQLQEALDTKEVSQDMIGSEPGMMPVGGSSEQGGASADT